jgi:ABC-type amino acid transport substrate-binding protein
LKVTNSICCFILSLSIIVIISGCYFNNTPSDQNTLTVGIASGYAPFISLNENGAYEGFDIAVITLVAEKLNRKLKLIDLGSMASLFMALNQGSVDALIWGLSITQDRCTKVAMVNYQGVACESYPLIFWNEIPENIRSIENMQDMTVCVEPGSAQEDILNKYTNICRLYTEKVDDALLNIQYKKADAALVEPAIAKKFKARFSNIQMLDIPLAPEEQEQGIGIAIKKDNSNLIDEITRAVNELKEEGMITQLEQKWGIS